MTPNTTTTLKITWILAKLLKFKIRICEIFDVVAATLYLYDTLYVYVLNLDLSYYVIG